LEKGNADLLAEKARGLIFSADVNRAKWQANLTLGHKRVDDFIFLEPSYPPQLTIRGAFPSFNFNQTNARINSMDLQASIQLNRHFSWLPKASLVRAFNLEQNDWIIQMPADRIENGLLYRFADGKTLRENSVKLMVLYVARQTRVPGTGNIEIVKPDGSVELASDYAPPPPDYTLFGLEMTTTLHTKKRPIHFVFTGVNLLNKKYRDYMNTFRYYADEVGINLALKAAMPLGKMN
jgi:iron complex outermembrane receptor protein